MKVIFTADVPGQGRKNDVKEVADGYAYNYLFKKQLAVPATAEALQNVEKEKAKHAEDEKKLLKEAEENKEKLANEVLEFAMQVGEEGQVFGSVTNKQIAAELQERGYFIEKNQVMLDESLNELGEHQVTIKLHKEISATVVVKLHKEGT